jgi:Arc/MetJ-type ribon-helix-helix transcriptional regulator
MSIVPVKLEKEDVKKLDMLVRLGVFKNRSQAIRWMLRDGMDKKIESLPQIDLSGVEPVVELMMRLASRGANVIRITSAKTAGEMVSEGRHRL